MVDEKRQPLPLPEKIQDGESKSRIERALINSFVEHLTSIQISTDRVPVTNSERLTELLYTAQSQRKTLVFTAIGCQDWLPAPTDDPQTDKIMGKLSSDQKRVARFSQEMADFSQALSSFDVPHRIHLSLSNIEPLIHIKLQNMGLRIHNPDTALLDDNVHFLADLIRSKGGNVDAFIHSSVLQQLTQTDSLRAFQELIAGHPNPTYRDFLDNEYRFDVKNTAAAFVQPHELGPVWLDIQSFSYHEDVISLARAAQELAPEMPLLSIFPNAGNWSSRTRPQANFPSRLEVLSTKLGFDRKPETEVEWLKKLRKAKNEPLVEIISTLLQEAFQISSVEEKNLAIRIIYLLVFGVDPLEN